MGIQALLFGVQAGDNVAACAQLESELVGARNAVLGIIHAQRAFQSELMLGAVREADVQLALGFGGSVQPERTRARRVGVAFAGPGMHAREAGREVGPHPGLEQPAVQARAAAQVRPLSECVAAGGTGVAYAGAMKNRPSDGRAGRQMSTWVPLPSVLRSRTWPPCSLTISLTMLMPRPAPRVRPESSAR